jgi:hypothetical protein
MRIVQVTGLLRVCSNKTLLQKRERTCQLWSSFRQWTFRKIIVVCFENLLKLSARTVGGLPYIGLYYLRCLSPEFRAGFHVVLRIEDDNFRLLSTRSTQLCLQIISFASVSISVKNDTWPPEGKVTTLPQNVINRYPVVRRHIPEEWNFKLQGCEKFKSHRCHVTLL